MKTAIIYASKHGTTQKVADEISNHLARHEVALFNIRKHSKIDLSLYDQVILGGSIHAGTIQQSLQRFINQNTTVLLQKKLALFLCCMYEKEAQKQFENAFPEILRNHASSCQCVGGEFIFENMNLLEKLMTKKIAGISQSVSRINHKKIKELSLAMD
ncbi:flavodoxin domain-containing protein [Marinilabilia rubra]|uniref:Flavodoxin n=1 Tax=Marinilabilia rubra TaxID=2162893 RepID=A0A2U2B7R2_9BACT|nr:flavodoxin domain-containing protein [Marinilabilia rubra]PWD99109.1 flavodoxin [Marinilabilia rubra]